VFKKREGKKRIKEEAEKRATIEKGVSDTSLDVDSKETHDRVQEGENKVGMSFLFYICLPIHLFFC
jgi:protein kinase C substrate 80K-H